MSKRKDGTTQDERAQTKKPAVSDGPPVEKSRPSQEEIEQVKLAAAAGSAA